jgi:hypothetical protein
MTESVGVMIWPPPDTLHRSNNIDITRKNEYLWYPLNTIFIADNGKVYRYKKLSFAYGWQLDEELTGRIWPLISNAI